jgi:hypothetical protein
MSFEAGNMTFDDYAVLKVTSDELYSPWEPYSISNDYDDADINDITKNKKGKKRIRFNEGNFNNRVSEFNDHVKNNPITITDKNTKHNTSEKKSYASIAKNHNKKIMTPTTTEKVVKSQVVKDKDDDSVLEVVKVLKDRLNLLEIKQLESEKTMKTWTANVTNELTETNNNLKELKTTVDSRVTKADLDESIITAIGGLQVWLRDNMVMKTTIRRSKRTPESNIDDGMVDKNNYATGGNHNKCNKENEFDFDFEDG